MKGKVCDIVRILRVLGGANLIFLGIALYLWFVEEFADDNDFQGHPSGTPFNEKQQSEYLNYKIAWSLAAAIGIGGMVAVIHGIRKH